ELQPECRPLSRCGNILQRRMAHPFGTSTCPLKSFSRPWERSCYARDIRDDSEPSRTGTLPRARGKKIESGNATRMQSRQDPPVESAPITHDREMDLVRPHKIPQLIPQPAAMKIYF